MTTAPPDGLPGAGRFAGRALLGLVAVLCGAVPFLLLLLLVQTAWAPLSRLDEDVAQWANALVSTSPAAVDVLSVLTDLGGTGTAVYVHLVLGAFLWLRGQRRLTWYVVVTGVGLSVLVPVTKAVVDRARPVVQSPVVDLPGNASFPSGHAMTSLVTWGVLACVVVLGTDRRWRPWAFGGAAVIVLVVGLTRLALGVHFVSDVLAGWALGLAWLAACTAGFRAWQTDEGRADRRAWDPLLVQPDPLLAAAPLSRYVAAPTRRAWGRLAAAALAVLLALSVAGVLVTRFAGGVVAMDVAVVRWLAERRDPLLTDLADAVSALSGTRVVVMGTVAVAVLGLAVWGSWQPARFVTVVVGGEVLLYFLVSQVVGRLRPDVPDLTQGLPTGASWPSGHVAAAVALYGSAAVLLVASTRWRRRWPVLVVPLVVAVAVGLSRLYVAAHHPSDVAAGLVLGAAWTAACAWTLLPESWRSRAHPAPSLPARHWSSTPT